jgi:hypothetical protein
LIHELDGRRLRYPVNVGAPTTGSGGGGGIGAGVGMGMPLIRPTRSPLPPKEISVNHSVAAGPGLITNGSDVGTGNSVDVIAPVVVMRPIAAG